MSARPPVRPPRASGNDLDRVALEWFVRERRGLSVPERAALTTWLASHPDHPAALARWRDDGSRLDQLPQQCLAQIRQSLEHDKNWQTQRAGLQPFGPRHATGLHRRHALAVAATTLGVSALGLALWRHWERPIWQQQFASRRGQQLSLVLPDGSRVQIDTQTQLTAQLFPGRRYVHLSGGQAAFHVAPDAERPFHVWAGDTRVTVVGTRFTVRHTPDIPGRPGVQVAVTEGRVQIETVDVVTGHRRGMLGADVSVAAGQQVASDGAGHLRAVAQADPNRTMAWRRQRVRLDDVTLAQAVAEFERYGDTHLRIASPGVAAPRITGTFNALDLRNFLQALPQVLPVRLLAQADGWTDIVLRG
ncbi:MAG: Protein FecR [Paracidovorax wautersii]|uniref:Protein FecR n=1 Tax=Paracidovorax wautersii TaxID=1177982 RepID=A0A7V8FP55_9BURK|nr:MAG: Protein FecR [Paracidovorax wautersii]